MECMEEKHTSTAKRRRRRERNRNRAENLPAPGQLDDTPALVDDLVSTVEQLQVESHEPGPSQDEHLGQSESDIECESEVDARVDAMDQGALEATASSVAASDVIDVAECQNESTVSIECANEAVSQSPPAPVESAIEDGSAETYHSVECGSRENEIESSSVEVLTNNELPQLIHGEEVFDESSSVEVLTNNELPQLIRGEEVFESDTVVLPSTVTPETVENVSESNISAPAVVSESSVGAVPSFLYPQVPQISQEIEQVTNRVLSQAKSDIKSSSSAMLLSEHHLRHFYLNEQLETVDDFVDEFCQRELRPSESDPFFACVSAYRSALLQIPLCEAQKSDFLSEIDAINGTVWTVRNVEVKKSGECNCRRSATGSTKYPLATHQQSSSESLRSKLIAYCDWRMQTHVVCMCNAQCCRVLCEWMLADAVATHALHVGLGPRCPVRLCMDDSQQLELQASRIRLRHYLSVIFYFMRQPNAHVLLADCQEWICFIVTHQNRSFTRQDQQFLLNQFLRCGVPLTNQLAALVHPLAQVIRHANEFENADNEILTERRRLDHCVAMLYLLLAPIVKRDEFLHRRIETETDTAWTLVDDFGEEEESRVVAANENDLLLLLEQFSVQAILAVAGRLWPPQRLISPPSPSVNSVASQNESVVSMFAFQLTLMKVLFDGMQNYNRVQYKLICKKLACMIKDTVCFSAMYWRACCSSGGADFELPSLQAEFDRLLLFGMHALLAAPDLGIWQYLVELPVHAASLDCVHRCCLSLVAPTQYRFSVLCGLDRGEVVDCLAGAQGAHANGGAKGWLLSERVQSLPQSSDSLHLIAALGQLAAVRPPLARCQNLPDANRLTADLVEQLFWTCFCNEKTRAMCSRAGAEAFCVILGNKPEVFGRILQLIDRNLTTLEQYACEVLSLANLSCIVPSEDDLAVIGKWLVAHNPDTSINQSARSILVQFNYGPGGDQNQCAEMSTPSGSPSRGIPGALFLDGKIHTAAAEIVVAAHRTHCKHANGLIAASIKKASKIAARIDDHEAHFDHFCWQLLLKLKLDLYPGEPGINAPASPAEDTAAFYVHVMKHCLIGPRVFLEHGLPLLWRLVDAGCFVPSIAILARLLFSFAGEIDVLMESDGFCTVFERCAQSDQSALAAVWSAAAAWRIAGPLAECAVTQQQHNFANILMSAMVYQLSSLCTLGRATLMLRTYRSGTRLTPSHAAQVVTAWAKVLTSTKCGASDWRFDVNVKLPLLDVLARCVMVEMPSALSAFVGVMQSAHQVGMEMDRAAASRGVLNWISGTEQPPTVAMQNRHLGSFPWLSIIVLAAEQCNFDSARENIEQCLVRNPQSSLESCVKKTATRQSSPFAADLLPAGRWLSLCISVVSNMLPSGASHSDGASVLGASPLPLALQQLCLALFRRFRVNIPPADRKRKPSSNSEEFACVGQRYVQSKTFDLGFRQLLEKLVAVKQVAAVHSLDLASFYGAVVGWLNDKRLFQVGGNVNADGPYDYLFHLVIGGDAEPWLNLVDVSHYRLVHERQRMAFANLHCLTPPTFGTDSRGTSGNLAQLNEGENAQDVFAQTIIKYESDALVPDDTSAPPTLNSPPVPSLPYFWPPASFDKNGENRPRVDSVKANEYAQENIEALCRIARNYSVIREQVTLLVEVMLQHLANLYTQVDTQLDVQLRCSKMMAQCQNPSTVKVNVTISQVSSHARAQIAENAAQRRSEIDSFQRDALKLAVPHMAALKWLVMHLDGTTNIHPQPDPQSTHPTPQSVPDGTLDLFYHMVASVDGITMACRLTGGLLTECMHEVGSRCVKGCADRQPQLLDVIMQREDLLDALSVNFTPDCLPPAAFVHVYGKIVDSLSARSAAPKTVLCLLSKFNMESALASLAADTLQSFYLIVVRGNGAARAYADSHPDLAQVTTSHAALGFFVRFPEMFAYCLRIYLEDYSDRTSSQRAQSLVLNTVVGKLVDVQSDGSGDKVTPPMPPHSARAVLQTVSTVLASSRRKLGVKMVPHWRDALPDLCRLVKFAYERLLAAADLNQPLAVLEQDVQWLCEAVCGALSRPFLEPVGGVSAPWTPDDSTVAAQVTDCFVQLLLQLNRTYAKLSASAYGSASAISLFWQYYAQHFTAFKRTPAKHVHSVYNDRLSKLPWNELVPTLHDMDLLCKCLTDGSPHCRPLAINILVRLQWQLAASAQSAGPVADAAKAFYAMLLTSLAAASADQAASRYCRASLVQMILSVLSDHRSSLQRWLDAGGVANATNIVGAQFEPSQSLVVARKNGAKNSNAGSSGQDEVEINAQAAVLRLLQVCCEVRNASAATPQGVPGPPPFAPATAEQLRVQRAKQALYVKAVLQLIGRAVQAHLNRQNSTSAKSSDELDTSACASLFYDLLRTVDATLRQNDSSASNQSASDDTAPTITTELVHWLSPSDSSGANSAAATFAPVLMDFLMDHPASSVGLGLMHDALRSEAVEQTHMYRVVECGIEAYFMSGSTQCSWPSVCRHLRPPTSRHIFDILGQRQPQAQSQFARPLTIYALCRRWLAEGQTGPESDQAQSLVSHDALARRLVEWLNGWLTPKLFPSDASAVLLVSLLLELLVRQCAASADGAKGLLESIVALLQAQNDERPQNGGLLGAIGLAKKAMFPARFRLVCHLLELYIAQQMLPTSMAPAVVRLTGDIPVVNAKVGAASNACRSKLFAPFTAQIKECALPFFTDPARHTMLQAPEFLLALCQALYIERYLLAATMEH